MTTQIGMFLLMVSIVLLSFLDRYGHGIVDHMTEDKGMSLLLVSIVLLFFSDRQGHGIVDAIILSI